MTETAEQKLSLVIKRTRELFCFIFAKYPDSTECLWKQGRHCANTFWNNHSDKICKDVQCDITGARGADRQLSDNSVGAPAERKGNGEKCHTLRYIVALLLIKLEVFSWRACWHKGASAMHMRQTSTTANQELRAYTGAVMSLEKM